LIIVVTLSKDENMLIAGPDIVSRGFVYVRESETLMDDCKAVVLDALEECFRKNVTDWNKIKSSIKDSLSEFLWKRTKRSPMILPIITEV
jgi:ribonuclease J